MDNLFSTIIHDLDSRITAKKLRIASESEKVFARILDKFLWVF